MQAFHHAVFAIVCHQRLTGIDITTADGALYRSAALSWTFPEPFVLGNTNGARISGTVVDTAGIRVTQQYPGAQASSGNIYAKATASITGKNVTWWPRAVVCILTGATRSLTCTGAVAS